MDKLKDNYDEIEGSPFDRPKFIDDMDRKDRICVLIICVLLPLILGTIYVLHG